MNILMWKFKKIHSNKRKCTKPVKMCDRFVSSPLSDNSMGSSDCEYFICLFQIHSVLCRYVTFVKVMAMENVFWVMNVVEPNLWPCIRTWAGAAAAFSTSKQTLLFHVAPLVSARLISLLDKSSLNKETSPGLILLWSLYLMRPKERASADLFGCLKL